MSHIENHYEDELIVEVNREERDTMMTFIGNKIHSTHKIAKYFEIILFPKDGGKYNYRTNICKIEKATDGREYPTFIITKPPPKFNGMNPDIVIISGHKYPAKITIHFDKE